MEETLSDQFIIIIIHQLTVYKIQEFLVSVNTVSNVNLDVVYQLMYIEGMFFLIMRLTQ